MILFVADDPPSVGIVAVTPIADDDVAFTPEPRDDLSQLCRAELAQSLAHGQRAAPEEVGQDAGLGLS